MRFLNVQMKISQTLLVLTDKADLEFPWSCSEGHGVGQCWHGCWSSVSTSTLRRPWTHYAQHLLTLSSSPGSKVSSTWTAYHIVHSRYCKLYISWTLEKVFWRHLIKRQRSSKQPYKLPLLDTTNFLHTKLDTQKSHYFFWMILSKYQICSWLVPKASDDLR